MANWSTGYWLARKYNLTFLHRAFMRWEDWLQFGKGEVSYESVKNGRKLVYVPMLYLNATGYERFERIIRSHLSNTIFHLTVDQNMHDSKWQWMADKDVSKLEPLFHDRSKFVHMSGTWKKDEELDIIKTGRIWYKQADVHDVAGEVFENTAVVWSRITLHAMVGAMRR